MGEVSRWRRRVFDAPGLTQAPPGPHLAALARRWKGLPGGPDDAGINLTGVWLASGYQCPAGVRLRRKRVSVSHEGEELVVVKIDGDPCVPAGRPSIQGRLPPGSRVATVTLTVGSPLRPASATRPGSLRVIDREHFRVESPGTGEGISFVRVGQAPGPG
jgi:hypothetical protein